MDRPPFGLIRWRDADTPAEPEEETGPGWADPGGHLTMWSGVYAVLATYGFAPHEVDRMECWTAALFMGRGATGDERIVLRGSRWVSLPSDDDGTGAPGLPKVSAEREQELDPGNPDRPVYAMRPVRPGGE